ncbi:hypothetical protein F7725_006393 [Dissostichus mawsoni]|uniref:Uncharacterized protein n=1 Tax=Dissostichus mawsoni TaxID=36200 RepID=A0A7J5XUG9_DISMA|nr:hypothetical protein F7725_006393 [Dissostichus mawsoni]
MWKKPLLNSSTVLKPVPSERSRSVNFLRTTLKLHLQEFLQLLDLFERLLHGGVQPGQDLHQTSNP